jgi:hypothetical protein
VGEATCDFCQGPDPPVDVSPARPSRHANPLHAFSLAFFIPILGLIVGV